MAQAAHDVILVLVPGLTAVANELLVASLSEIEYSEFKYRRIQAGMDAPMLSVAGAATEVFKKFFNKDKKSFTIGCNGLPDVTRTYRTFSEFSEELALSRIYIGYHF